MAGSNHKDVNIYDIARLLNVSTATVSRALKNNPAVNKATRKKILATARKMGYRPNNFASNLRSQKTNTIGVIIHELNSNFIISVLTGIEKVTAEAGYDIIIAGANRLPGLQYGEHGTFRTLLQKRDTGCLFRPGRRRYHGCQPAPAKYSTIISASTISRRFGISTGNCCSWPIRPGMISATT
jgi:DNA-binding LacI/PurR family transcriptional regulator